MILKNRISSAVAVLAAAFVAVPSVPVQAQGPAASVERVVASVVEIVYTADNPTSNEVRERVQASMEPTFSFDLFVGNALGRNRTKLSPAELTQINELTTDLMLRSYLEQFQGKQRPQIRYGAFKELGRKGELPSVITADGSEIDVLYRLANTPDGWRVYDVIAEGVGVVRNYRSQFDDHFVRSDATSLIAKLRRQLED